MERAYADVHALHLSLRTRLGMSVISIDSSLIDEHSDVLIHLSTHFGNSEILSIKPFVQYLLPMNQSNLGFFSALFCGSQSKNAVILDRFGYFSTQ